MLQRGSRAINAIPAMEKIIRNLWSRGDGAPWEQARILMREVHPEGLDLARVRFVEAGLFAPDPEAGHIISLIRGKAELELAGERLALEAGVHLYLPPGARAAFAAEPGAELVQVSAPAAQARGRDVVLRDETFLSACAADAHALRWILTPQYLSRRIFLHHDPVLLSRSGDPVSWFRTTMFDVSGLPPNQEGEPVFKMSYNSRTEFNVIYEVSGEARVRFAHHPYDGASQSWSAWHPLDGELTYHLNEAAIDPLSGARRALRNKHEVYAAPGAYATLLCLFDPAPVGIERHRPGEYSDYEPMAEVLSRPEYAVHQREIARFDRMVDRLSWAKATGELGRTEGTAEWDLYQRGREAQIAIEAALSRVLTVEGGGRERVLERWRSC